MHIIIIMNQNYKLDIICSQTKREREREREERRERGGRGKREEDRKRHKACTHINTMSTHRHTKGRRYQLHVTESKKELSYTIKSSNKKQCVHILLAEHPVCSHTHETHVTSIIHHFTTLSVTARDT